MSTDRQTTLVLGIAALLIFIAVAIPEEPVRTSFRGL